MQMFVASKTQKLLLIRKKNTQNKMNEPKVGPNRPLFVLFGSSIVQLSYYFDGWGAALTGFYARKVLLSCEK